MKKSIEREHNKSLRLKNNDVNDTHYTLLVLLPLQNAPAYNEIYISINTFSHAECCQKRNTGKQQHLLSSTTTSNVPIEQIQSLFISPARTLTPQEITKEIYLVFFFLKKSL